jgi:hypothetical protein
MTTNTDRIRALNDELRQFLLGGMAVITPGIAALGTEAVDRIVKTIMFKIDYFDRTLTHHSPDPSDASVTERVITIMLAEEY